MVCVTLTKKLYSESPAFLRRTGLLWTRSMSNNDSDKDSCTDVECPTCGRDDFDTVRGMKWHHSYEHGESISGVEKTCEKCGDTFRVTQARTDEARFCSEECTRNRVTANCGFCEKELVVIESRVEKQDNVFCDRECKAKWTSENRSGEDSPRYKQVTVVCEYCGGGIKKHKHRLKMADYFYCDDECKGHHMRETYLADKNPNWAGGGSPYYGPSWNKTSKEVRERDNYECVSCGLSEEGHIERYGRTLDVHHVSPRRSFEDFEKANDKSNLVTLCRPCHERWEKMAPLAPVRE